MNKKYKILLIGWYGHGAIGDDIIAETTKRLFFAEAERRKIKIEFVPFQKNYIHTFFHNCFYKDDLIIIGGGSILGFDSLAYRSIFGFDNIRINKLMINTNTPLVIFGGGFRKEREKLEEKYQIQMRKIFDNAILKGIRGPITQQLLISNKIVNNVDIVGDPVLSFCPVPIEDILKGKFNVGMNVRCIKSGEMQYVKNEYIYKIFAKLADYFIEENANIHFFSFAENRYENDIEGAKRVIKLMKNTSNIKIMPFSKKVMEMGSLIGKFDYLISQRLHPCIIGWIQQIPNIGFEYQFLKTKDFMSSIGMDEFVIRTDEFSFDKYLEKYEKIIQNKKSIIDISQTHINHWAYNQKQFVNKCIDIMVNK